MSCHEAGLPMSTSELGRPQRSRSGSSVCAQAEPRDWAGPTAPCRLPAQPSTCSALCDALRATWVFHFSSLLTISRISHKLWASSLPVTCRCTTKSSAQQESHEMLGNMTGVSKWKHPLMLSLAGNYSFKVLQPIRLLERQDIGKALLVYLLYTFPFKILGSVCQCYISNENSKVQKMVQKGNQGSSIQLQEQIIWPDLEVDPALSPDTSV